MVTVRIKENSKQARAIVEMLRAFPFAEILEEPRFNATTEKALKDARAGKGLHKAKDVNDLMDQLNN